MGTIADQLRLAIERSGKTRYRISKESGVAESMLSRFVSGERELSLDSVEAVAKVLGLRVAIESEPPKSNKSTAAAKRRSAMKRRPTK